MTISDFTERELVGRIQQRLPPAPGWMVVGIGDDAAVVEPERNRLEVLSVDALVEGVHFDRSFTPPDAIGHRALAVNLSDLAAMGATPRLALLSLALPEALPLGDFDGIVAGFAAHAVRQIAEASEVGASIDAATLPIDPDARAWFASRGADPLHEAIARGDDYELVVAVRPRSGGRLLTAQRHGGVPLTRIGVCTA